MGGCLAVLVLLVSCEPLQGPADQGRRSPDANAAPVIPLPAGSPVVPRYGVITEVAMTGVTQRFRWRDKDENWPRHELAVGRGVEHRCERLLKESDYGRATVITGPRGAGVGAEAYIGSRWTAHLEVTATPAGPRASLRLNYFPQEGVVIGFGLDSRRGVTAHRAIHFDDDDIAGARLMFYIFARQLVASATEGVAEYLSPISVVLGRGGE